MASRRNGCYLSGKAIIATSDSKARNVTKAILISKPESGYKDIEGERYHFDAGRHMRSYLEIARRAIGDWVVFHFPVRGGGRPRFTAIARVVRVEPDGQGGDGYFMRFDNYLRFDSDVPLMGGDGYFEHRLRSIPRRDVGRELRGRSIRELTDLDFAAIVHAGLRETFDPENALRLRFDPVDAVGGIPDGRDPRWSQVLMNRKVRDAAFRNSVLKAYANRCAITGLPGLINGGGKIELEAAHVKSVAADGPDIVVNGMALTGTVHWMFDRGLITVDSATMTVLISHNKVPHEWRKALPQLGGQLHLPASRGDHPHPAFLDWHREKVFGAM